MTVLNLSPAHGVRAVVAALAFVCAFALAWSAKAQVEPFVGYYKGSAELVQADGSTSPRQTIRPGHWVRSQSRRRPP